MDTQAQERASRIRRQHRQQPEENTEDDGTAWAAHMRSVVITIGTLHEPGLEITPQVMLGLARRR